MATPHTAHGAHPIAGRRAQLAAVADALARLEQRGAPILALSGEPGIGQTRLAEELGARADAGGPLFLPGPPAELEPDLPVAVAVDALGDYAASLGVGRLNRLAGAQAPEL